MRTGLIYGFVLVSAATAVVLWHTLHMPTRILMRIAARAGLVTR